MKLGRGCDRELSQEQLEYGMDFRELRCRRAVFLRFYQFHLKYRSHPGCVYYLMPELAVRESWTAEQRLWFAYINGNTQNPVTSWIVFREFPSLADLDEVRFARWFKQHYARLAFDTDRRYFKKSFLECVTNYREHMHGGECQVDVFRSMLTRDPRLNFERLWVWANSSLVYFGRLSVFSYLEYLSISGLTLDCTSLFLEDREGSRSHRNGLCKVLGRDDLDWHESNPEFDGNYTLLLPWLKTEGDALLVAARTRVPTANFFTLESALCTYKSWHRPNRRYPNCYNDMLVERIRHAEREWGPLPVFWDIRRKVLPPHLRLEDNSADCGVKPLKQNHYLNTGEVIMMDEEWPCFRNSFNDDVRRKQAP